MPPILAERLYHLLPSFHRARDADQGEPLRALLGILEGELSAVQDNVEDLYDDLFIETCAAWVAPYLGELCGAERLAAVVPGTDGGRTYIANAVAYRRRKGTAGAVSSLVRDLTGWPARAVEFYQLVALFQPINHLRPTNLRTPSLRRTAALRSLHGPFEKDAHTVDLRSAGKYALDNIGVFIWRLISYPVNKVPAAKAQTGCYWFDPLGRDAPLWNPLRSTSGSGALTESSAPGPLASGPLGDALEALRYAKEHGMPAPHNPYFDVKPAFQIFVGDDPVPPERILIADLAAFSAPPYDATSQLIDVVVDPRLGRLVFVPPAPSSPEILVSSYRGFSSEVGGGFYDRSLTLAEVPPPASVSGGTLTITPPAAGGHAIVEIADSLNYALTPVHVPMNATLELRAANKQRPLLSAPSWAITLDQGATLILNGLLLDTDLVITAPAPATLSILHATVVPGHVVKDGGSSRLTLELSRSITGPIVLDPVASSLSAVESIVDGGGAEAVQAGLGVFAGSTVLGKTTLAELFLAEDTIFDGPLVVADRSRGLLRTCFVPQGSKAPPEVRCQPSLAIQAAPTEQASTLGRVRPSFTSTTYGMPGYAQLRRTCPSEILEGGSDQSEMGVFHHLYQPRRQANLRAGLDAYLRFGLEVTLFFVT